MKVILFWGSINSVGAVSSCQVFGSALLCVCVLVSRLLLSCNILLLEVLLLNKPPPITSFDFTNRLDVVWLS